MSVFSRVGRLFADHRETRSQIRTRRILDALPPHIRHDIGYRGSLERNDMRQRTGLPL